MKSLPHFSKLAACGILCFAGFSYCDAAKNSIPWLSKAPICDGKLSDGEYATAWKSGIFKPDGTEMQEKTEVMLGYDAKNLYVAFKCLESNMAGITKNWRTPEEHDNAIWLDDCVDIIISLENSEKDLSPLHFIINPNNVIYDSYGSDIAWNPITSSMTNQGQDQWSVEIAIPFDQLGITAPQPGDCWRINAGRTRQASNEFAMLKAGDGGFLNLSCTLEFSFGENAAAKSGISVLQNAAIGGNSLVIQSSDSLAYPVSISYVTYDANGKKGRPENATINEAGITSLNVPSSFSGIDITAKDANGNLLRDFKRRMPELNTKKDNDAQQAKPLFSELFTTQKRARKNIGHIFWMHGLVKNDLINYGMQFGEPATHDDYFKNIADGNLWGLSTVDGIEAHAGKEYIDKYNLKFILYPLFRSGDPAIPYFNLDKESEERYLYTLRNELEKNSKYYKAVFYGDESYHCTEDFLVNGMEHRNEQGYEFINEADEIVKNKYGFGKYGIPESQSDLNVFKWLALRAYINDATLSQMRKFNAEAKKHKKDILMISDDPMAAFDRVYDYADFTPEVCDVITHQTYPRDNLSDYGFLVKFMKDLSQVNEIWPCVHVEEYGRSYLPDEVRVKISEAVRNGATALHYYLNDTVGRRKKVKYMITDFYGAPDRAQVEIALAKEMLTLPPLKFPKPEIAVYTPIETQRSYLAKEYPIRTWVMHTRLERDAKTAFVHVNTKSWSRQDIDNFKAVFLPDAKYASTSALEQLVKYVSNGGTLFITDAEAFSFTPDGNSSLDNRKSLFGNIEFTPVKNMKKMFFNGQEVTLASGPQYAISPDESCTVIGKYENSDDIAVISRKLGNGNVYIFGANIMESGTASSKQNGKFVRQIVADLGAPLDCDIWRFEFPESIVQPPAMPKGQCLTGNSVIWRHFKADTSLNDANPNASYIISADTAGADQANVSIPLPEGRLTNRQKAITSESLTSGIGSFADWADSITSAEPFAITFDLATSNALDRIRLVFRNNMRDIKVSWSEDGQEFKSASFIASKDYEHSAYVRDWTLNLPADAKGRFVKLEFAAPKDDAPDSTITLAEIEIWK